MTLHHLKAIILAGGIGTRMRPLTYLMPKSMLPIGGKPLLERTITWLKGYGIRDVVFCVAYLRNQIIDYFGDGSKFDVTIEYAEADMPLGTAGQLKTAEKYISDTFFAMNGDIVTTINLEKLVDFHKVRKGAGTIALKKFEVKIPYGHITVDSDSSIRSFQEKPVLSLLANAGTYILEPEIFDYIPSDRVVSLETETFSELITSGKRLNSYYEDAYWADVGTLTDFERVDKELLSEYFSTLSAPQAK
ncbi:MAG: NDP-sugar synthase [Nitrososphaerales archaeon]